METLDDYSLDPEHEGAYDEESQDGNEIREENGPLTRPDEIGQNAGNVESGCGNDGGRGYPLQVHERRIPDDAGVCVEEFEYGDKEKFADEECPGDGPEA